MAVFNQLRGFWVRGYHLVGFLLVLMPWPRG